MKILLIAVSTLVFGTACAPVETNKDVVKEDKEYVTGSNLPKRDRSGVKVVSPEEIERASRSAPGQVSGSGPR